MGIHEVTREEFEQFVKEMNYVTEAEAGKGGLAWDEESGRDERKPEYTWKNAKYIPSQKHPVVFVTQADAQAFCEWLSRKDGRRYSLPTEAQWEFACRAGTTTPWYSGTEPDSLDAHEWFKANSDDRSHAVGGKSPTRSACSTYPETCRKSSTMPGKPVHRRRHFGVPAWLSRSAS